MRISVAAACLSFCLIGFSVGGEALAAVRKETNIPAEGLGPALNALAKDRHFQIVYVTEEIANVRTEGAVGDFTTEEALKRLLGGTGLIYRYLDDKTVTIGSATAPQSRSTRSEAESSGSPEDSNANQGGKKSSSGGFRVAQVDPGKTSSASSIGSPPSSSQESSNSPSPGLAEIVVTAQKREERLQSVPISISVLSGSALDNSSFQGVSEALNAVPGVATTNVYLGGGTNIEIRGVGASFPLKTGPSAVAYYVDSVPFGLVKSAVGPDASVYDLERVEVLRGPQGTLYGSSALNGVVRILTNDPNLSEFDVKVRGSDSGTDDGGNNYGGDATINVPIVQDVLAVRATVGYMHDSGWIDQPDKRNANDTDASTYRLKIAAQPTQELAVGLSAWSSRQNSGAPDLGYTFDQSASLLGQPISTDYDAYGAKISYQLPWFSISSMTSYLDYKNIGNLGLDVPGFGFPGSLYYQSLKSNVASEELNLTSSLSGPWRWSLGGMYRHGTESELNSFTVVPIPTTTYADDSKSYAIYGELTRMLLDGHLELTAGLRHFHDDISQDGENGPGVPAPLATANAEANTPRALVAWHLADQLMLYGSYSQGFRSGFPQDPSVLAVDPNFAQVRPDRLFNYELGAKGNLLDGRLSFDASVYHMVWNDIQLLVDVPINNLPYPGVVNGARAVGNGVDLSLVAHLADHFTVSPYVSWNNLAIRGNVNSGGEILYHDGDRPSGSPETTAGLATEYSFPIGSRGTVGRFSASGNYTSPQSFRTTGATSPLIQSSDAVVVARARFTLDFAGHWSAALYGDNLNNFHGVTAIMFPSVVPNWEGRLRPLTAGVQLEYHLR